MKKRSIYGYLVAIAAAGPMYFAMQILERAAPLSHSPFLLVYMVVLLATRFGGLGPGVFATIVSTLLCDYAFIPPVGQFFLQQGRAENVELGVVLLQCIIIVAVTHRLTRALEKAKASKEAAEAALKSRSNFLANVSHEIRTPLTAILGFSEILLQAEVKDDHGNFIECIHRNGRHLLALVDDILDMSRIENDALSIERTEVSLPHLVAEVVSLLGQRAREKRITLEATSDDSIPEFVNIDPKRLRQILLNIVGNAVKFTDHGYVALTMHASSDGQLTFLVQDTGIGISPEQLQNLFKPFGQGDPSTTRRFGGTGLGLLFSRRLAQAMGGDVELLDSRTGLGSIFRISVDAGPFSAVSRVLRFNKRSGGSRCGDLEGRRILLVEDDPDVRFLMRHILLSVGASMAVGENGFDGVTHALNSQYDAVLMDLQLPKMDGYEAVRRLREAQFTKPIIALTAHAMKGERERCIAAGFDGYVPKPIDRATLVEVLAKAMSAKSTSVSPSLA